jgi:hypothetical protein
VRNRRTMVLGAVGIAVVAAIVGWVAGSRIQSPDAAKLEASAPEPSLITVPVESRSLASNVVVRGDIAYSDSTEIRVEAGAEGAASIVTGQVPEVGDELAEGSVAIEVGGRPVIVLGGELPMYRSLAPGSTGDDVRQLEEAMARLGLDPGAVDGTYDGATENAVTALYARVGYAPKPLTAEERTQLDAAEDAVTAAQDGLRAAERAAATAGEGVTESQRLQAEQALRAAERAVTEALEKYTADTATLGAAVTAATTARDQAQNVVTSANQRLQQAQAAAATATQRLQQAQGGTHPDTGLPPTAGELADLQAAKAAADADVAARELDAATAQTDLAQKQAALVEATTTRDQTLTADVRAWYDAQEALRIEQARYRESLRPPDTSSQFEAIVDAREAVTEAQADLDELRGLLGVRIPKGEVLFLAALPRRITSVNAVRGQTLSGAAMTASGADLRIRSAVSEADRPLVKVGDRVSIEEESLGVDLEGVVTRLDDEKGKNGAPEGKYFMEVTPEGGDPLQLQGLNVRITVGISSTDGEVLAVPLAALSASADGSSRVQVERSDGTVEFVEVRVGLSADGYAEVEPVDGDLTAGDQVVVGRDSGSGPDEEADEDGADEAEAEEADAEPEG